MLPADIALLSDPVLRAHIQTYADDQEAFFTDFAKVRAWRIP
jgi:catalase (peroxidase I)